MSEKRRTGRVCSKKTVYTAVALLSAVAGLFAGTATEFSEYEPTADFYRQPYSSGIFDYREPQKGASRFVDMSESDWFYGYVDGLVRDGVVNGKSEDRYDPSGTLTLPECAALIVRCLGLESEARLAASSINSLGLSGFDRWYIGYMKVCVDAGAVPSEEYGFGYDEDGNFVMKHDYFESVPIKRCELARLIYRMTLLDEGSVRARNTYSERGGYGHEFIRSGLYDTEAVGRYAEKIADFENIPELYREGVLGCYYNGIFNGDDKGNFNPESSITRAEMAKVVSVLTDISQRFGEDLRESAFVISDGDTRRDIYGEVELTKDAGYRILSASAEASSVVDGYVRLPVIANAPMGYAVEAHVYSGSIGEDGETVSFEKTAVIGSGTKGITESGDCIDVGLSDGGIFKAVYLLRNIADGGKVEGVLEMSLENGGFVFSDGVSRH